MISFNMHLLHFILSGPFIRCRYSWGFAVSGQMNAFSLLGCKVSFLVAWSITAQPSPYGLTRGSGFLGAEVGFFMVAAWFSMSSFPWRRNSRVLYLYTCGTFGGSIAFWCTAGGIGSLSSGMMWVAL